MNLFNSSLVAAIIVSSIFVSTKTKALIGGETAAENKRTADLSKFVINLSSCTLTRISTRHFLTAAHCWSGSGTGLDLRFKYGPDGEKQGVIRSLKRHSFFDWQTYLTQYAKEERPSDLQVYEIGKEDVAQIADIAIAPINFNFVPKSQDLVFIAGYGGRSEDFIGKDSNGTPLYRAVADGKFRTGVRRINKVTGSYILITQFNDVGKELRLARGDSGGPLFNEHMEVIGVNSFVDRIIYPDTWSGISRIDTFARSSLNTGNIARWIQQFVEQ